MDKWLVSVHEYPAFISFDDNTCINRWSIVHFSFGILISLTSLYIGYWSILMSFLLGVVYEMIENSGWFDTIDNIWNSIFDIFLTIIGTMLGFPLINWII